jgi:hypothetical protein
MAEPAGVVSPENSLFIVEISPPPECDSDLAGRFSEDADKDRDGLSLDEFARARLHDEPEEGGKGVCFAEMKETVCGTEESGRQECEEENAGKRADEEESAHAPRARTVHCRCEIDPLAIGAEISERGVDELAGVESPGIPVGEKLERVHKPVVEPGDGTTHFAGRFHVLVPGK